MVFQEGQELGGGIKFCNSWITNAGTISCGKMIGAAADTISSQLRERSRNRRRRGKKIVVLMHVYFETLVITRVSDYCAAPATLRTRL